MIFSLKRSALSIALLSLCAVAPSIATEANTYTKLSATNIRSMDNETGLNVIQQLDLEYQKTKCVSEDYHKAEKADKAVIIFDRIITNDNYSSRSCEKDCDGHSVVSNCDSYKVLNRRSLVSMNKDREQLESVYGMLTEKQQKEVRKNAVMTRAEEFAKRQTLINRAISARKNTKYGKLENAFLHTKNFVSHKATRVVTGTAALIALGYLAHRKGLDRSVVSSVSNGAVTAYNTVLSEQARTALELAAQKSCHAVVHGSVIALNATKKAGQAAVESAKRLGAYVVSLFKRRVVQPIVK